MEFFKIFIEKVFGTMIGGTLISDANRTTSMMIFQPRVPVNLKKFSKLNKE